MHKLLRSRLFVFLFTGIGIFAILTGLFLHQTRFGISGSGTSLWLTTIEQGELDEYIEFHSDLSSDEFLFFRFDNRFPSKNADDYRKIYAYVNIKNSSLLEYNLYDCFIEYNGFDPLVSFVIPFSDIVFNANTNNEYVSCCMFLMYCPEMDDEQIKKHIQEYQITLYLYNDVFKDIKYVYNTNKHSIEILEKNPYYG